MVRFLFASFFLLVLAGCSDNSTGKENIPSFEGSHSTPAKGDVYVSASLGKATSLVPWLSGESASSEIAGNIYLSVLKYDKNLSLTGELAKSWQVSADNLSLTFQLHDNVRWHDGLPVTTEDISATFHAVIHPETRTPYAGDYQLVKKFEVLDAHRFRVTYAEPFAPALASWAAFTVLPAHILKLDDDFNSTRLKHTPLGSGPYEMKIEGRNPDVETAFSANTDYFDGEPWMSGKRIRVVPDQDTQFLELKAGNIDAMGLSPVQYTRLTDEESFTKRYAKHRYLGNGYTYVGFKLSHPIFKDQKVRMALAHATPRRQIIKGVLFGQGEPIEGPFKPGTWAYNEKLAEIQYNPQKAKEMLGKAGWVDADGDGILEKEINGKVIPMAFTLITNQGNAQRIKTAEILQQYWRQVGVDVKVQVQEWSTFIENTINPKNFEAFILGWSLTPEPDPYDIWHSSKTGPREFNIVGFNNPEADALMTKARQTFDQAERKEHLDRFQEIIQAEQPYIFLYAPYSLIAIHRRIQGIEPAPAGLGHNSEKWFVPKAWQMRMP